MIPPALATAPSLPVVDVYKRQELLDGARQLALAAQFQALALHALADAEAGVLEQDGFAVVAGVAVVGQTGAGQAQPDVRIVFGTDQHALAIHLIGDLLLIQVIQGGDQLLGCLLYTSRCV